MPCNIGHRETDVLCCVKVNPVLLAGCIYVCQVAVVGSKMAQSLCKEGVVKLKARAKPVIHWWRKRFLGEHHKVQRDIFMLKVSAKLGGNPHVSPGCSTHLGQQTAAVLCGDQTHHKQQSHQVLECHRHFDLRILMELKRLR